MSIKKIRIFNKISVLLIFIGRSGRLANSSNAESPCINSANLKIPDTSTPLLGRFYISIGPFILNIGHFIDFFYIYKNKDRLLRMPMFGDNMVLLVVLVTI